MKIAKKKVNFLIIKLSIFIVCRARGYPEPIVTWRREDGAEIVLKDQQGQKQHGEAFCIFS